LTKIENHFGSSWLPERVKLGIFVGST